MAARGAKHPFLKVWSRDGGDFTQISFNRFLLAAEWRLKNKAGGEKTREECELTALRS